MFLTQQLSSINSIQDKDLQTPFHWLCRYGKDFWKQSDWVLVDGTNNWLTPNG